MLKFVTYFTPFFGSIVSRVPYTPTPNPSEGTHQCLLDGW